MTYRPGRKHGHQSPTPLGRKSLPVVDEITADIIPEK